MPRFVPGDQVGAETLAAVFNRGYEGYFVAVQLDPATFLAHAEAWDLDLSSARVALSEGAPVAFALLGVRAERGWIGGMGVVPEHRGRGLGRLAMEAVIAEARARSLERLELEVIEQNVWAARIYEALGFRDTRTLEVWARPASPPPPAAGPAGRLPVEEALEFHRALHPVRPPWQRDLPSLRRQAAQLEAWAVRGERGPVAMAVAGTSARGVGLLDLAAAADAPPGALESLLGAVLREHPDAPLSFVNLPAADPAAAVLAASGAEVRLRQREMALVL